MKWGEHENMYLVREGTKQIDWTILTNWQRNQTRSKKKQGHILKKKRNPQSTKNSNRKLISEIKTHIYIYKVAFIISKYEIAKKKKKA